MTMLPSVYSAVMCLVVLLGSACASVILNSNAIKNTPGLANSPGHQVSESPDEFGLDGGSQNLVIDSIQSLSCVADEECGDHGFCFTSRGACLPCKRRRKRCIRDAMCCPGNQCSNGLCLPVDPDMVQQIPVEDLGTVGSLQEMDNSTAELSPITTPQQDLTPRGQEGENCLRSSDCSEGLCCARHFWSKICKPVLKEGQVCTKHKRKGAHGLEIFQRCDCAEGLACRTQRTATGGSSSSKAGRSLHTCQRH